MASGNAKFMVAAVSSSLNLSNFWLERPHTWFNMCESAFAARNIVLPVPSLRGQVPHGEGGQH